MKFRSSLNGYITALRFYKGSSNTGVHVGHIWDVAANLLGQATFTGETASFRSTSCVRTSRLPGLVLTVSRKVMRLSFGKAVGTAARVGANQKIMTFYSTPQYLEKIKDALNHGGHKLRHHRT